MYKRQAQCIVTVTRDDTALEEAIAAAESRMKEENFAEKYTEATRKALEDDLADAKAAKDNTALSVEEVKLIVESLKTSIEGLQLKAVVTINNNGNTETKYCEIDVYKRQCQYHTCKLNTSKLYFDTG